ncbi:primosomal replication protein [Pectobacteriaceae bacterium CE70]|uniref:Prephenate dehydrogenase n=1 Tax=Serratia sp. (strain ATCC 39006) TaxID=104623 RepID=A0A2I5TAU1_SERS3|nr:MULTISPECIES: primosomal replication protein [Enterobacterales]WJV63691.1 primosomal replication protein [Pectobacteriaceae bacterium C52]WJV68086.1 primosomal replication protein [Pectobacteriaceae bacterium CE70]WJY12024.1 primosomal replication protein [Pectobacteriaceae bacterium C80]AUH01676.1 prephenate dehydrogenase [Serratia sp. ATCC 39006]AUH05999.1 prephenate dehydrogenase [Serratia sp. ATCC 39006]
MNTQTLLQALEHQITTLAQEIASVATHPASQSRFDRQLFSCYGTRLGDYLHEVQQNHQHLRQYVAEKRTERVAFMAEKLLAQITALQRELATQQLRQQEPTSAPPKDLYHKLSEHQGFERRLLAMIQDRESLLYQQTTLSEQQRLQKELAALEGRLLRCRQALSRLEKQIERREQGH